MKKQEKQKNVLKKGQEGLKTKKKFNKEWDQPLPQPKDYEEIEY